MSFDRSFSRSRIDSSSSSRSSICKSNTPYSKRRRFGLSQPLRDVGNSFKWSSFSLSCVKNEDAVKSFKNFGEFQEWIDEGNWVLESTRTNRQDNSYRIRYVCKTARSVLNCHCGAEIGAVVKDELITVFGNIKHSEHRPAPKAGQEKRLAMKEAIIELKDENPDLKNAEIAAILYRKLTLLNKNFIQFVTKKIDQYPAADLTPTIKDYLKHISALDKTYYKNENDDKNGQNRSFKKALPPSAKLKQFEEKKKPESNGLSVFGVQQSTAPITPTNPPAHKAHGATPYNTEHRMSRKRQAKEQLSYDDYLKPSESSTKKQETTFKPPPNFDPFMFKKKDDTATKPSSSLPFGGSVQEKNTNSSPPSFTPFGEKKKEEAPSCPAFPTFPPSSSSAPSDPDPKPSDPTPPKFNLFGSSATDKKEVPKFNFLSKPEEKISDSDVQKSNFEPKSSLNSGFSLFGSKKPEEPKEPQLADLFKNDSNKGNGSSLSLFMKKPEGDAPPFTLFSTQSTDSNKETTTETTGGEEEEKEEPPKVEAVDQSEPNALFSTKCSVHILKEENTSWNKLGVGFANIKEAGDKNQLLVRAATTLGTIWINTMLNAHVKAFKMNEKKIKVRFPNKCVDEKTKQESVKISTYLITVGAAADCDKLAEYLNANVV
ncbi:unnamed protein product [Bursaphelenchus okinawaensis]|uniref:RanBD1 domain-containing protein n=1 Tax=Bursaphelenchus okinawaensis TaxID=465554 RepID=A0A811JS73_9BILA|nr:unnamed protein product [Bursaphelenchus okinawaensis]CAG9080779.1 unnamed protein product [Bursaphelenchus okinawaensis]